MFIYTKDITGETKQKFIGNISKTEVSILLYWQSFSYIIISYFL